MTSLAKYEGSGAANDKETDSSPKSGERLAADEIPSKISKALRLKLLIMRTNQDRPVYPW
jgi:hypothetical protein